ncbi:ribbon-helix-helix domain-containing protein [Aurantimonas sp. HBX-1]|uniref:ribbon-helix-helix domain-containing protein n=1 Tax=Aurantimonas sp. HBX-1 TaxID=2906072 RepID=UPI001F1758A1|nr:ribbon-helix-helix domain-containing protein [Aurantimonas sp. HBX-1]UIJ70746.1 ribbon-helix-helix domain-containing protein [Aurantimonas sp. HBX-1]
MVTETTTRVSFRLQTEIYEAIQTLAKQAGVDVSAFMQDVLRQAVYDHLPADLQRELENTKALYAAAQAKARQVYNAGRFDEHFTLTVFRELMGDQETKQLYESVIGVDAYTDGASKKMPLNMYLGWFIKNAVSAKPMVDASGKPRRAFVKDEPIKSYTLLTTE